MFQVASLCSLFLFAYGSPIWGIQMKFLEKKKWQWLSMTHLQPLQGINGEMSLGIIIVDVSQTHLEILRLTIAY